MHEFGLFLLIFAIVLFSLWWVAKIKLRDRKPPPMRPGGSMKFVKKPYGTL
jgi:hypothetical protein